LIIVGPLLGVGLAINADARKGADDPGGVATDVADHHDYAPPDQLFPKYRLDHLKLCLDVIL
jgi:hypothetical protein